MILNVKMFWANQGCYFMRSFPLPPEKNGQGNVNLNENVVSIQVNITLFLCVIICNFLIKGPFKKYVRIELGRSTAKGTCQCPCKHRQALRKNKLETKFEMKY